MSRYLLKVPNIACTHCKVTITSALLEIGERSFQVDVTKKEIVIETDQIERVLEKLDEIDYSASVCEQLSE